MNKTLGALTVAGMMLLDGGQEVLATEKPIELGNPTVGKTTEKVRGDVHNCIGKGQIKLPNGECAIMVNLVDEFPKTNTPLKEEISQLQKRGKEMQEKELFKLWGGIVGIFGMLGITLYSFYNGKEKDSKDSV